LVEGRGEALIGMGIIKMDVQIFKLAIYTKEKYSII
jgi:hypothetical protein